MDLLRSCYSSNMKFFNGSDHITRVKWFFCADKAQVYPGVQKFASRNWDYQKLPFDLTGEQRPQEMRYRDGSNPWGYPGISFVGPSAFFQNGIPGVPSDYPVNTDPFGLCEACPHGEYLRGCSCAHGESTLFPFQTETSEGCGCSDSYSEEDNYVYLYSDGCGCSDSYSTEEVVTYLTSTGCGCSTGKTVPSPGTMWSYGCGCGAGQNGNIFPWEITADGCGCGTGVSSY